MIRLAAAADWPAIARWRSAHYARMEARNGRLSGRGAELSDAVWLVADRGGDLLAACSFFDVPPVRTIFDLYWRPGFAGRRAAYELAGTVCRFADDLGLEVAGNTNIVNAEYRELLERAGFSTWFYDLRADVCYFRRRDREKGFRYVGKFQKRHADERQSSRACQAAGANTSATDRRAIAP